MFRPAQTASHLHNPEIFLRERVWLHPKPVFFYLSDPFSCRRKRWFFRSNVIALWHWLIGCVLGESEGWEEAHKTSNTAKTDVSGVGIRERLGGGQ